MLFRSAKTRGTPNRYVAFASQKVLRDQVKRFEERETGIKVAIAENQKTGKSTSELESELKSVSSTRDELKQILDEAKK